VGKSPQLRAIEHGSDATADEPELPYRIEMIDAEEAEVLALCGTVSVAYAAYYAGLREYFGRSLALRQGEHLLVCNKAS